MSHVSPVREVNCRGKWRSGVKNLSLDAGGVSNKQEKVLQYMLGTNLLVG